MKTVKQVLQAKGNNIWSLSPDASVFDAIKLMADNNVGALLVVEEGKLVGIISERDYARKVFLRGKSSKETAVKEIMTDKVIYVRPEQTVEDCMAIMTNKRIRHLPVLENDQLVGIISIGDLVREIMAEQEYTIHLLEQYITGR